MFCFIASELGVILFFFVFVNENVLRAWDDVSMRLRTIAGWPLIVLTSLLCALCAVPLYVQLHLLSMTVHVPGWSRMCFSAVPVPSAVSATR